MVARWQRPQLSLPPFDVAFRVASTRCVGWVGWVIRTEQMSRMVKCADVLEIISPVTGSL